MKKTAPMTKMKIVFVPADYSGCGYYRMLQPALALAARGHEVALGGTDLDKYSADVVVYQREIRPEAIEEMKYLQGLGKKIVHEIDDNYFVLGPENPAYYVWKREARDRLEESLALADVVTVTTKHLADSLARLNPNIRVLPNCVEEALLTAPRYQSDHLIVGWQGGAGHILDLKAIRSVVNDLEDEYDFEFVLAGVDPGDGLFKRYTHRPWVTLDPALTYVHSFADFTLGICPLGKSAFNDCKSDIKFVEYSALGIPTIAAKGAPYQTIKHGENGYLARNLADWRRYTLELLTDPKRRLELAEAAKDYVAAERTIQKNIWRWEEVYTG